MYFYALKTIVMKRSLLYIVFVFFLALFVFRVFSPKLYQEVQEDTIEAVDDVLLEPLLETFDFNSNEEFYEDSSAFHPVYVKGTTYSDSMVVEKDTSMIRKSRKKEVVYKGVELKYTDIPSSADKNTRQWLLALMASFNSKDYITGFEMARYYKQNHQMNSVVRSVISSFFKKNIHRITRESNRLVIHTVSPNGAEMKVKIPLLVSFSFKVADNASIHFQEVFRSAEPQFKNWPMLPIQFDGIDIVQKKDTIPSQGYINNNSYFVKYPESTLNYKFKK